MVILLTVRIPVEEPQMRIEGAQVVLMTAILVLSGFRCFINVDDKHDAERVEPSIEFAEFCTIKCIYLLSISIMFSVVTLLFLYCCRCRIQMLEKRSEGSGKKY